MLLRIAGSLAGLLLLTNCGADPEGRFTDGRELTECRAAVPVCTTVAGCVLDQTNYAQGSFTQGTSRRFVVRTEGPAIIEVQVLFTNQQSPGVDTRVTWNESGCDDRTTEASGGTDVFAEAGADRVWTRRHQVTTAGDHLVELFSDAQANYLLGVNVLPGH